jgi:cytochrome c551/c552
MPIWMLIVTALLALPAVAQDDPRLAASRELAASLQQQLGARLMAAMGSGGPVAAIEVCQIEAPAIAAELSTSARVGRTALKARNPANAPDPAARIQLERFEQQWSSGPAEPPEAFSVAADGSARYMQAIVTQALCVSCHGSALTPAITAAIAARYPDDAATGFAVGELRGAFLIDWPATTAP